MFEMPESLDGLDIAALRQLRSDALAAASELRAITPADLTDEQLDTLEALAGNVTDIDERIDASEARIARATAAQATLAEEEPADEPDEGDEGEPDEDEEEVEEPEEALEPLAASARTRDIARNAPKVKEPVSKRTSLSLVPQAGFAEFAGEFSSLQVTNAALRSAKGYPKGKKGSRVATHFADIERTPQEFNAREMNQNVPKVDGLIDQIRNERRLEGNSLTAAGGWCAPSEILYELCQLETTEGLLDLPRISVPRGGISFTKGFQYPDFAGAGFTQTEEQAEQGTEKPCIEIECPDFEEVRLDGVGLCVSAPLLTRAAYPELVDRYTRGLLIAHEHYVSAYEIAALRTILGSAQAVTNVFPNAISLLTLLEFVAEGERQRWRLTFNETLEVLLPFWVKAGIRADLANRTGVELTNVTDAQIEAHFTNRKLKVQWLYNFQDLTLTEGSPAENIAVTDLPSTVEVITYPAGTFIGGSLDVIELNTLYDSEKLSTNMYTALFTEEGRLVANTCAEGRRLSVPFNITGMTAAAVINQDWGSVPPLITYPYSSIEESA